MFLALYDETLSQVNLFKLDKCFGNSWQLLVRDGDEVKGQIKLLEVWAAIERSLNKVLGVVPAAKIGRLERLKPSQRDTW